jgi:drug/metabolite transporter (DMT)-like permease
MSFYELLLVLVIFTNITIDFLDKRTSLGSDAMALSMWSNLIQFFLILPLIGMVGGFSLANLALCAVVGAVSVAGRMAWYIGLSKKGEELSRIAPFSRFSSLISLSFAVVFFKETIQQQQIAGGVLMIIGAVLIGFEKRKGGLRDYLKSNRFLVYILFFAVTSASISILYKYLLLEDLNLFSVYFYLKLFQVLTIVSYSAFTKTLSTSYQKISYLKPFVANRIFQTIAALLYLFVLKNLPLSSVAPISAMSPFVFLVVDWVFSRLNLSTSSGDLKNPRIIVMRSIALLLIVLGAYFLKLK